MSFKRPDLFGNYVDWVKEATPSAQGALHNGKGKPPQMGDLPFLLIHSDRAASMPQRC
jgi:hypothetical protein